MWIVSFDEKEVLITDKKELAWGFAAILAQYLGPEHQRKLCFEEATTLLSLSLPFKPLELDSILGKGTDCKWIRIKSEEGENE